MPLQRVHDPNTLDSWHLYKPLPSFSALHLTNPEKWSVLKWLPVSPLELHLHAPGMFSSCVLIRDLVAPMPLLRVAFANKVLLDFSGLKTLAQHLNVALAGKLTMEIVMEAIARQFICKNDSPDVTQHYVACMLKAQKPPPKSHKVHGDKQTLTHKLDCWGERSLTNSILE